MAGGVGTNITIHGTFYGEEMNMSPSCYDMEDSDFVNVAVADGQA
jgi:hypothetical protein